jgi:bifunctional DNA-binding transcriptional regulator/antitoxin component of YhaV-PrlF toxin-antitoxin module
MEYSCGSGRKMQIWQGSKNNVMGELMQWRRSVTKNNGDIRKRFEQWGVPKEIRRKLGLDDGSECKLTARLGTYSLKPRAYVLTSGGEFRLPKNIADDLRAEAKANPRSEIVFNIQVNHQRPQSAKLEKARKRAREEGAFDPQNEADARERALTLIVLRHGQPAFRKKLLKAYNNRCAISGCDCPDALEAAHIWPYKGKYTNHIKNGILLRCDIHNLFDLGRIRIHPNYEVDICDDLQSTVYKEFHNRRLVLPKEKKDWPDCPGLK